jgi:DNA-binding Lrp family transcriptional regulator
VITTIVLCRIDPPQIPKAARMMAGIDGVAEVYSVSGEWDLVAIVRVPQYEDIARVVTETFPKVLRVRSKEASLLLTPYS